MKYAKLLKRCVFNCFLFTIVFIFVGHIIGYIADTIFNEESGNHRKTIGDLLKLRLDKRSVVLTYKDGQWSENDEVCGPVSDNVTILKSPSGDIPLYVYPAKEDEFVSGNLLEENTWETTILNEVYRLMKRSDDIDFVDIGAHVGVYTLTFARMGRRVLAVEPVRESVQKLCNSIKKGGFEEQVFVIHNPLSNSRHRVKLNRFQGNVGGTQIGPSDPWDLDTIETILLDDLLNVVSLRRVVVKMDVETHEAKVLAGAETFFSAVDVVGLLLEWEYHRGRSSGEEIKRFLTRHKMKPFLPIDRHTFLVLDDSEHWPTNVLWVKIDYDQSALK